MIALGINDSHDASAILIENGNVVIACSEERFSRRKRQQGFPYRSLKYIKGIIGTKTIDAVYIGGRYGRAPFRLLNNLYRTGSPQKNILSFPSRAVYQYENKTASLPLLREMESTFSRWILAVRLRRMGISFGSLHLVDHHQAHIISACTGIPSRNYLAVSLDAYGDGKAGLIVRVRDDRVVLRQEISYKHSIALVYAYVTAALGFREGEEGKVVALAEYGSATSLGKIFKSLFTIEGKDVFVDPFYRTRRFFKMLKRYRKKDVAFSLQRTVEHTVVGLIKNCVGEKKGPDLFLAGGLFANVKVNQRLHATGLFGKIFVFPHMGDGGLSFAAASQEKKGESEYSGISFSSSVRLSHVYLGPRYSDAHIAGMLEQNHLRYQKEKRLEAKAARLLSRGATVAVFQGATEYGPRALGNRSILYQTTDKSVNDWLNKKLRRSEFMPFAPVTLFEYKDACYKNVSGAETAARFMTISLECTPWMEAVSPGVVYRDRTARPQILKEHDNSLLYDILKEYHRLTGIPSLINTSFNMHHEPIVCTPREALDTFFQAGLDYLIMENFLVTNPLFDKRNDKKREDSFMQSGYAVR